MRDYLAELFAKIATEELSFVEAAELFQKEYRNSETLGFAVPDFSRAERCGFPEVIFGHGKTMEQICAIAKSLREKTGGVVLATRLAPEAAAALMRDFPDAKQNELARTVTIGEAPALPCAKPVLVISAGTSDLPVAEEAGETLLALGCLTEKIYDVGVAGLHRLLRHEAKLREAVAIVVVAGMEGALPSVVGGLVGCPVIAVPTSVGYGASFGGVAALLGMLNTCAAGVTVVNIDNGFGAASAAARIVRTAAN